MHAYSIWHVSPFPSIVQYHEREISSHAGKKDSTPDYIMPCMYIASCHIGGRLFSICGVNNWTSSPTYIYNSSVWDTDMRCWCSCTPWHLACSMLAGPIYPLTADPLYIGPILLYKLTHILLFMMLYRNTYSNVYICWNMLTPNPYAWVYIWQQVCAHTACKLHPQALIGLCRAAASLQDWEIQAWRHIQQLFNNELWAKDVHDYRHG